MANILVNVVTKFDAKALLKGQKQLSTFDKSLNKLGKTFLGVFAAQKVAAFGKASVNAFLADEKAARSLAVQLKNTGNAFATPGVEAYIKYLEQATGVLDDQLRPAFQNILTVTGSVQKSQEGLNTALNVAAGTGRSVEEVSLAIAKAYSGQTTGLQRLGVGLDAATLKGGNMSKILTELDNKFKGQAIGRTGYAKQVDDLNVAWENVKETVGKGVLDAFAQIGGKNGLAGFTDGLIAVADALAKVFNLTGKVLGGFANVGTLIFSLGKVNPFAKATTPTSAFPGGDRAKEAAIAGKKPLGDRAIDAKIFAQKKAELDLLNKKNIATAQATKDEAALAELRKKFDVERAGLQVALANATDEETKARIRAQLQILDDQAKGSKAVLDNVNSQLAAAKATDLLRASSDAAASALATMARQVSPYTAIPGYLGIPTTNASSVPIPTSTFSPTGGNDTGVSGGGNVTINLQSLDPSNALQVIQDGIQQLNRYGMNLAYAGSLGIVG
jgi:hypothetical protein